MSGSTAGRRGNLPAELSSFVGRRHELASVRATLGSHRLVTLLGPGGIGKSRQKLQAANRQKTEQRDAVIRTARDDEDGAPMRNRIKCGHALKTGCKRVDHLIRNRQSTVGGHRQQCQAGRSARADGRAELG